MNRRFAILITLVVLVLGGVPVGVIWPSIKEIRLMSQTIYQQYESLEEKRQRGQDIRRARTEYEELRVHLPTIRRLALEPKEELRFITALEELADQHSVTETLMLKLEGRKTFQAYDVLPLEIVVRGPYRDVLRYIAALRTLPMVTSLTSVSIVSQQAAGYLPGRGDAAEAGSRVEARLTGNIFQHRTPLPSESNR